MVDQGSTVITEQIRQASDIVDIVSSYVTLRRAGAHFKALCPFHQEKTASFQVNVEKQIFKCFGCGVGGDVFKFIQLREGMGFLEARAMLAAKAGIRLEEERSQNQSGAPAEPSKSDLERANRWACRWFQQQLAGPLGEPVRTYIHNRGISEESVSRFALGFAPEGWSGLLRAAAQQRIPVQLLARAGLIKEKTDAGAGPDRQYDAFRNRLIFPIIDVMGRVIGFGGRALGDDAAKYLNSPQNALFDKSRCLYGLNAAKEAFREQRFAVIVEGYVDCLMAQQFGFLNTVATLGTALTLEHVRLLRRYVDGLVLVFDSDEAGQRAADHALGLALSEQLDVKVAHVPEAKDPADLLLASGSAAFQRVLTSACDALEFKWRSVSRRYESEATGPGRRRAIEEFLQLVAQVPETGPQDPIQRGLVLNRVAKLLGLPSEDVYRQLRMVARRSAAARSAGSGAGPSEPGVLAAPRDAASKAMRELLGVLLNEPSYYASLTSVFDPEWITDAEEKEIARAVAAVAGETTDFSVSMVISRFESVQMANKIIALQTAAEVKGNYAAIVEGAVHCLSQARAQHRLCEIEAGLRTEKAAADEPAEAALAPGETPPAEALAEAHRQGIRQMSRFAARRHYATTVPAAFRDNRSSERASAEG